MSKDSESNSDLEDLVSFLHHGNTQIRQVATHTLLGYSSSLAYLPLWKGNQLQPLTDLKLLVRDYEPIAHDALVIITNLTGLGDGEVLRCFARDDEFVGEVLKQTIDGAGKQQGPRAEACCGLLSNLVKDDTTAEKLISMKRKPINTFKSDRVLDQLMDVFIRTNTTITNTNKQNPHPPQPAAYDYLSYVFADLSKHATMREYLVTPQPYDSFIPLTKLTIFTDFTLHTLTRRRGISSVIKNTAFSVPQHPLLMRHEADGGVGLLPYILLPLAGGEELSMEDMEGMLDELVLLPNDKKREPDDEVCVSYLETLLLLTTTRDGRDVLRRAKVYPVIRELHLHREGEGVREASERLVDVLMRDEAPEEHEKKEEEDDEAEHQMEEIF